MSLDFLPPISSCSFIHTAIPSTSSTSRAARQRWETWDECKRRSPRLSHHHVLQPCSPALQGLHSAPISAMGRAGLLLVSGSSVPLLLASHWSVAAPSYPHRPLIYHSLLLGAPSRCCRCFGGGSALLPAQHRSVPTSYWSARAQSRSQWTLHGQQQLRPAPVSLSLVKCSSIPPPVVSHWSTAAPSPSRPACHWSAAALTHASL